MAMRTLDPVQGCAQTGDQSVVEMKAIEGRYQCSAVTVSAPCDGAPFAACQCGMSRPHPSRIFVARAPDQSIVKLNETATCFRSSDWREWGFCAKCGSTLGHDALHGKVGRLATGFFGNAAARIGGPVFNADQYPRGYRLEAVANRMSSTKTVALCLDISEEDV